MDVALVQYINRLCRHLAITPARLHPHEVYLDPADAADPRVACLLSMWVQGDASQAPLPGLPCGGLTHDGTGGVQDSKPFTQPLNKSLETLAVNRVGKERERERQEAVIVAKLKFSRTYYLLLATTPRSRPRSVVAGRQDPRHHTQAPPA